MRGLAAAQTLAQRGSARLCRPASAMSAGQRLSAAASGSPALCTVRPASVVPANSACAAPTAACCAPRRCFSWTAAQQKKGGKKDKKGAAAAAPSSSSPSDGHGAGDDDGHKHPAADVSNPFDFADVESRWQRTEAHYEDKFKELRRSLASGGAGALGDGEGGVDVDAIGRTPVALKGDEYEDLGLGHGPGGSVALAQLALVIPRSGGRVVELRMHNPASRKAIVSAVQSNPLFHGQQPQPDPNDELVLLVKLGGAAAGAAAGAGSGQARTSALAAAAAERTRRVTDLANAWRAQIRKATARRQKTHQQWKKEKAVVPNDLHRLDQDLLKGQEKRMAKIDAAEKDALKQADRANKR